MNVTRLMNDDAIIFILPVASPEKVCCGNCSGEEEIGDGGIDYVNVKTFLISSCFDHCAGGQICNFWIDY